MSRQSRYVSVKLSLSCVRPEDLSGFVQSTWDDASIVWASHREEGKHPHFHAVIRFPSVRVWFRLWEWCRDHDPHYYCEAARSWRRSVRYLLHLDNPEKGPIPWESLDSRNIDDSELAQLLGSPKGSIVEDVLSCVSMSPGKMLGYLLSRGYGFHEITGCVNAFLACGRFNDFALRNDVSPPVDFDFCISDPDFFSHDDF